jgi:hypothetical protein
MEGCSPETSDDFQPATRRYIQEDRALRNHRYQNLKSYKNFLYSIWYSKSSDNKEYDIFGYNAVHFDRNPRKFSRNVSPISSGSKKKPNEQEADGKQKLICLLDM